MPRFVLVVTALAAVFSGVRAVAQVRQPAPAPSFALLSLTGRDSFDRYCATCHGVSGRGDGPVGASLKARPSDLTTLARRNGGVFPRNQVLAFVEGTGRAIPAHGPTEMPLWGGIFRWLDSAPRTTVRLNNLVAYVESLQLAGNAAVAQPGTLSGADLFRTFCASCHGSSGRGDGPMAGQLRRDPPDLTTFQMRNRGVFPADRLRRIIDGMEIAAHGNRTMPVWGDVFRREQDGGRTAAAARVDALVRFLQSIQERPAE
jgi:mono/diheme cytochrome c family protein